MYGSSNGSPASESFLGSSVIRGGPGWLCGKGLLRMLLGISPELISIVFWVWRGGMRAWLSVECSPNRPAVAKFHVWNHVNVHFHDYWKEGPHMRHTWSSLDPTHRFAAWSMSGLSHCARRDDEEKTEPKEDTWATPGRHPGDTRATPGRVSGFNCPFPRRMVWVWGGLQTYRLNLARGKQGQDCRVSCYSCGGFPT